MEGHGHHSEGSLPFYNAEEIKTVPGFNAILGKGGYGTVLRSYDQSRNDFLAIKLVEPTGSADRIVKTKKRYSAHKIYRTFLRCNIFHCRYFESLTILA